MRNVMAAVKAGVGVVALVWAAAGGAQLAGTQSAVVAQHAPGTSKSPVILLSPRQPSLASTCGGSPFNVATFINVNAFASADVKVTAPGVGLLEEFTDETGQNLGSFKGTFPTFHIKGFGGGLPPNTPITIIITTYTGANLTGSISSVSSLTFNCTTGIVLRAPVDTALTVPSLSSFALAATAGLLLALGAISLRRVAKARSDS